MEPITIQDVGPITEHTLPVEPGVTILTGGNEAGKSTAISCVAALAGRNVDLAIRDGAKHGMVRGLGTTITVGARKTTRAGEFEAEAVEDKIDLSTLVDPGVKQPAAATRKRIKALLSLTGQSLTVRDFYPILPEGRAATEILGDDTDDDPVEMAGKIKRRMEGKAREWEQKAEDLETTLLAKSQLYMGVDLDTPHDSEALQAAHTVAVREHEQLKAQDEAADKHAEARRHAEAAIGNAQAAINERKAAEASLERLKAEKTAVTAELEDARVTIIRLKRELDAAQAEEKRLAEVEELKEAAIVQAQQSIESVTRHCEEIDNARRILHQPGLDRPSLDDLSAAEEYVKSCQQQMEQGAIIRKSIEAKEQAKEIKTKLDNATNEAVMFRSAADATDSILSAAVAADTLKVIDGDLYYVEGSRKEPFARLSAGRRFQVAICEVAKAVAKGSKRLAVLPLDQVAWDGMDHATRDMVHHAAVEHGIAIVTGQIRDAGGELASTLYKANGK